MKCEICLGQHLTKDHQRATGFCQSEATGSEENRQTPYFGRGYKDRLFLMTEDRDEFGETHLTERYISDECGKRMLSELGGLL